MGEISYELITSMLTEVFLRQIILVTIFLELELCDQGHFVYQAYTENHIIHGTTNRSINTKHPVVVSGSDTEETSRTSINVEALWPSGQGLKASTPRSEVQTSDNAISTGSGQSFNSRKK
ncbi:hypothetical protein YC2023_011326 [Brassica napus]